MKKKFLSIMSLAVVSSMMMVSLTGCGTQVKATDQEVTKEEAIIVADEESSEEVAATTEDEITETEEIIADDETEEEIDLEASVTEHEYFFALDKQDSSTAEEIDWDTLKPNGHDFELKDSVTIYGSGKGRIAGYTKPNINVYVVTSSDDWYCIEFKDEDPAYQLLLVKAEDFIASAGIDTNVPVLTFDDVRVAFEEELNSLDGDFIIQDEITDDMEFVDFNVPIEGYDVNVLMQHAIMENRFANYTTFALEQVGEPDVRKMLTIRFYFK